MQTKINNTVPNANRKVSINFAFEARDYEMLKRISEETMLPMAELVRRAVKEMYGRKTSKASDKKQ